jgi:hypothetical protein
MLLKPFLLLSLLVSVAGHVFSQNIETKGDDVYVDGQKRFKVVVTKKINFLTAEMPHFVIYDANDVERIKYNNGFLRFSDSKSYLSDKMVVDPNRKALTKFLAKEESLFLASGYNKAYESKFVLKYGGHLDNGKVTVKDENGLVKRDYSKGFSIEHEQIIQDEFLVGYIQTTAKEKKCVTRVATVDRKTIAVASYSCDIWNDVKKERELVLELENGKEVKLMVTGLNVEKPLTEWLIKNNKI